MSFHAKEIEILRDAVDKAEKKTGKKIAQSEQVKDIINIVEGFIRSHKLICYGGTAINNILPASDQFYNRDISIPDYDFFSSEAVKDAKSLADKYKEAGYTEVEAKAGIHYGTYKVFVNFIPVADITQMEKELFKPVEKEAIQVDGILYAPPNYLRMAMYLELSRPEGDIGRWEKVLKRLILLNKHYPMKNVRCNSESFMRSFESGTKEDKVDVYNAVKDALVDQGVVFFGGYAATLYGRYMPDNQRKALEKHADFDVLSDDPKTTAIIIKERLKQNDFKNIKFKEHPGIGEIIPSHYEVTVGADTVCFIYEPIACHSYNKIKVGDSVVKVATIDTMLSFFLAFLYADKPYYDHDRILCMAQYLFTVQSKNRLKQKGLLQRFSINCYGKQKTIEDIRGEKSNKHKELQHKKGSKEYEEWFLRYIPSENKQKNTSVKKSKKNIKTNKKNISNKVKDKVKDKVKHKVKDNNKKYWQ